MKLTSLTKENGKISEGSAVQVSGGIAELFNYLGNKVDWRRFRK